MCLEVIYLLAGPVTTILFNKMRYFTPALALVFLTAVPDSGAQVKKGGFFGFGRNDDQISAGLFPVDAPAATPVQTSAPAPPQDNDGIFRRGEPSNIEPVSYVIEDGERIEVEVPEKRNFFAFGRREKAEEKVAEMAPSVPDFNYQSATEPVSTPTVEEEVTTTIAEPRLMQDIPEEAIAQPEEEKKSGGFFSFFSRKKDPDPIANEAVITAVSRPVTESTSVTESATPVAKPTMVEVPSVPEFADTNKPKKEKNDRAGILPPLPKIKIPKKPTNYENVETIIEDGEIIGEGDSIVDAQIITNEPSGDAPPRMVNGVTTYSSWDDVGVSTGSAADKILKQIR